MAPLERPLSRRVVAGLAGALAAGCALLLTPAASAVPSVRGSASAATAPARALTVPLPARARAGDLLVAVVRVRVHGRSRIAAPGGWRLVRRDSTLRGRPLSQTVYVRRAEQGEVGGATFVFGRRAGAAGTVLAIARADLADPVLEATGRVDAGVRTLSRQDVELASPEGLVLGLYAAQGARRVVGAPGTRTVAGTAGLRAGVAGLVVEETLARPGGAVVRPARAASAVAQTLVVRPGPLVADFETGDLSEFDSVTVAPAGGRQSSVEALPERAYDGRAAARARVVTGAGHQYARGTFDVEVTMDEELWFGAALFLPPGFYESQYGQVDLLRWDNWSLDPVRTDRGGIVLFGSDHRARLVRGQLRREQHTLVGPFALTEGTWHRIEVHQRLSAVDGEALSEVFLDGTLVGASRAANAYGRPATRVRFGIVACGACVRGVPLELWLDHATVSRRPIAWPPGAGGEPDASTAGAQRAPG